MLPFATAYHRRLTWRYFALFIAIGMTGGLLGPALPHLADSVGASMSQIAILFTTRAVGNMSGAFVTGLLLDRFDGHKVLFAMGAIMVTGLVITPFSPLLILLAGLFGVLGFAEVALNSGGNTNTRRCTQVGGGKCIGKHHPFFSHSRESGSCPA